MKTDRTKNFKAGSRIIARGDKATIAYLILKGTAKVLLERDGKTVKLADLDVGAIFGETALFGGSTYGAHVEAVTDIELGPITPESFAGKVQACDPTLRTIVEMLIDRLRTTNEALLNSETREFMDITWV